MDCFERKLTDTSFSRIAKRFRRAVLCVCIYSGKVYRALLFEIRGMLWTAAQRKDAVDCTTLGTRAGVLGGVLLVLVGAGGMLVDNVISAR